MRLAIKQVALLLAWASGAPLFAQTMTIGVPPAKLRAEPYLFDTAEEHAVKVTRIAEFPNEPFDLVFLPDGDLIVAERGKDIRIVHGPTTAHPTLDPVAISGVPEASPAGEPFERQDLTLHPGFAQNGVIYFCGNYRVPEGRKQGRIVLMRGKLAGHRISDVETLVTTDEVSFAGGCRLQFAQDGTLYMTTGAPFEDKAQRLDSLYGKVLRINDDGSIPKDNPFVGQAGARPEIYTYGHRDQIGLTMHPVTGQLLTSEHGPSGGDEVNLVGKGKNYGWPNYSFGRQYDGSAISEVPLVPGIEAPLLVWSPSIAPSGLMIYEGDEFPAWKGNLFVTSARRGEINNTGGIERVVFNDKLQEMRRETLFTDLHQRFRDVVQGPDGAIYALVERGQNALLRIEPATPGQ